MPFYFVTVPDSDGGSNFLIVSGSSRADVRKALLRNNIAGRSAAEILEGSDAERAFAVQYPECAMLTNRLAD